MTAALALAVIPSAVEGSALLSSRRDRLRRVPSSGLARERRAILRAPLCRTPQRAEHVAEQLARRRERTGRDSALVGRILAPRGLAHHRQRRAVAMLGQREPRLRAERLDGDLLRPVRLLARNEPTLDRSQ